MMKFLLLLLLFKLALLCIVVNFKSSVEHTELLLKCINQLLDIYRANCTANYTATDYSQHILCNNCILLRQSLDVNIAN